MDWKKIAVKPNASIRDVIDIIDKGGAQIALVVDENDFLLGTVTDGDVRRGILKGFELHQCVTTIFNNNPVTVKEGIEPHEIAELMRNRYIRQIPITDQSGRIVRIELLKTLLLKKTRPNWAIIMAGGLGTRLRPLTESCPKPLLKIAGQPILEIILQNLSNQGFSRVFISLNYKGEMIVEHFGDGSQYGLQITYLRESHKLGTAGALGLLPELPKHPIIVMNGDLLTRVNFEQMIDFHERHDSKATMGVIEYKVQVPYGVVNLDDFRLKSIDEKPIQKFFINAGIYILEPQILKLVPHHKKFDMTELFQNLLEISAETVAFPIREFWLDIGNPEDYIRANEEFPNLCSD